MKNINTNSKTKRFQKFKQVASLIVLFMLVAISAFAAPTNYTVVGVDKFNGADGAGNSISQNGTILGDPFNAIIRNGSTNDFTFDCGAMTTNWDNERKGAIIFRYTNTSSFYAVTYHRDIWNTGNYIVRLKLNTLNSPLSPASDLASYSIPGGGGVTSLKVTVVGSSIQVMINGTLRINVTNSVNPTGGYGFGVGNRFNSDDVSWNNVVWTPACATRTVGAASSAPSPCINTSMTARTHVTTNVTGISSSTGLPAGVTASYASNTISISGTPTASGIFNYTITPNGCGSATATGTITVTPANTAGSPSSTPTLSVNNALTNITHTTTGATGIANAGTTGANGLPAGVAASLNNNTITIYGTPSAVGIYNYSIPLSGGCGSVNATGTITVNPAAPATPGTISGTTAQCAGLASQTYSIAAVTNATSYTWTVPTGWSITAGTVTNSITVTVGASGQNGNVTVKATNSGGTSAAQTLAVTASSNNTVGTASSTPTVCINTALTNITHTTTGATGIANAGTIGANGLPAGVAASLNNNTITIFGTPSAAGIYNYSIQLLGGCGSVNATGTITVTATKTVGSPSSTPTLYTNTALTDITIPTTGATGIGTATGLPAGVTAAWALNTITISGTPTADGTFGYSIPLTGDCGNINATGTITVIPNVVAPTAGSSAAILTFVSQTAITFTFTKGNGANRIIVAKSGSASSTNPTNNTSYAANAAYGSGDALDGFVVYNSDGQSATITNLTAGTTYHFSIYEYNSSGATILYSASTKYTTSATTLQPDADNDGVADADDQYPNDQYKAFNNNYPAASFGTLMYEDLWPGKGDYDFNDLVVDYKFNTITNADNNIVEIRFTFVTRAIGGSLHNGFAFQLDGISQEKITSVTGSKASGAPWISLNSNGTEAGQLAGANILVFDDAYKLLQTQTGFSFVNVYPGSPDSGTDTTTILVKFLSDGVAPSGGTLNYSAFNTGLFNPYLIAGQDRGKEIHLADRIPTSKMNLTYFGQNQDRTNPSTGKYFKTADNLPWGINVDSSIPFATEKTDISEAYLNFIDWATSGGASSINWFLNQDGNRNSIKLMNR
jgi:LruC domain-containing protein